MNKFKWTLVSLCAFSGGLFVVAVQMGTSQEAALTRMRLLSEMRYYSDEVVRIHKVMAGSQYRPSEKELEDRIASYERADRDFREVSLSSDEQSLYLSQSATWKDLRDLVREELRNPSVRPKTIQARNNHVTGLLALAKTLQARTGLTREAYYVEQKAVSTRQLVRTLSGTMFALSALILAALQLSIVRTTWLSMLRAVASLRIVPGRFRHGTTSRRPNRPRAEDHIPQR